MGKRYYLTTLGAWQRHAHRFANSHWVALGDAAASGAPHELDDAIQIAVLIEADEGTHLTLEDDAAFEALPHPLAQQPISAAAQAALAPACREAWPHGVAPGATTFDAAEALARLHPLLKHHVF
jgi:hypothetical protein